ncbi:MAG: outer membrane lipoprotein-sorting protein [Spirochaetales bacterium]|nr:outer membrane lipoprotein-sorting protein [Spirochaetales bacterium]
MKHFFITATILLLITTSLVASPNFQKMLEDIDRQSNFDNKDFSSQVTMIHEDPEEGIDKTVLRQFRRDRDDMFVILLQSPEVKKGQGYLRAEENLWFYDPESRKFSHSSMKENFQGSEAKNSDFRMWTYSKDYTVESWADGKLGNFDVWILDLKATHNEVTYPYKKFWITKNENLLLKTEDYSLNKRLMRTSLFLSYTKSGDTYIPNKIIFIDELIKGKKTQITFEDISTMPIPNSVFTKAYIERVSR